MTARRHKLLAGALSAATLIAAALALLASPAMAQTKSVNDKAGDQNGSSLDIRTFKIGYTKKNLTITTSVSKLSKTTFESAVATVETQSGTTLKLLKFVWEKNQRKGIAYVLPNQPHTGYCTSGCAISGKPPSTDGPVPPQHGYQSGQYELCKFGVKKTYGTKGQLVFTIPSKCIDSPKKLRGSVVVQGKNNTWDDAILTKWVKAS